MLIDRCELCLMYRSQISSRIVVSASVDDLSRIKTDGSIIIIELYIIGRLSEASSHASGFILIKSFSLRFSEGGCSTSFDLRDMGDADSTWQRSIKER